VEFVSFSVGIIKSPWINTFVLF